MKYLSDYEKTIKALDWANEEINKVIISLNSAVDMSEFLSNSIVKLNGRNLDISKTIDVDGFRSFNTYVELATIRLKAQLKKIIEARDEVDRKHQPTYDDYLNLLEQQLSDWNKGAENEQ